MVQASRLTVLCAALVVAASAAGAPFHRGDLVVYHSDLGLLRIDPVTGAQTEVCPDTSGISSGWPRGVAFAPGGVNVHRVLAFGTGGFAFQVDPVNCGASLGLQQALSHLEGIAFAPDGTAYMAALGALTNATADGGLFKYGSGGNGSPLAPVASAGLLRNATDVASDAAGMLYVSDMDDASFLGSATSGRVVRVDPASGLQTLVSDGGNLVAPSAIALEPSGELVVADRWSQSVVRVDPGTGAQTVVSQSGLLGHPIGLAVEESGAIVVLNEAVPNASVVRVDPVTGAQSLVAAGGPLGNSLVTPGAIDVALPAVCSDGLDNDGDGSTDHGADPGCASAIDDSERGTTACDNGVDDDGDGRVDYPADPGCSGPASNQETPDPACGDLVDNDGDTLVDYPDDVHCHALTDPTESQALPAGEALVADATAGVVRVNPLTGVASVLVPEGGLLGSAEAVLVEPDGKLLVADLGPDFQSGRILRIHPETQAKSILASGGGLVSPRDLVLDADGTLLVLEEGAFGGACPGSGCGSVLRIDRTTGAQTPVSSGGLLVEPRGIVREAAGTLLVTDQHYDGQTTTGRLVRVDPTTGAQSLRASGGFLTNVAKLALEPSGSVLVTNYDFSGVFRVDPATGAQTWLSTQQSPPFLQVPLGLVVEPAGTALVIDRLTLNPPAGVLRRLNLITGALTNLATVPLVLTSGISLVPPACSDRFDNDGDGLVDASGGDPGCADAQDYAETDAGLECDNGLDDDGDGNVDATDPACSSGTPWLPDPTAPREQSQCQDGLDNDGAAGTDFDGGISILGIGGGDPAGADLQCVAPWDNREAARSCGVGFELALALAALTALRRRRERYGVVRSDGSHRVSAGT